MSVYPVFDEESIISRFNNDIQDFYRINKIFGNENEKYKEFSNIKKDINSIYEFENAINSIIAKINSIRNQTDFSNFDYSHDITSFDYEEQKFLWIARTTLFYQLLIICTKMMKDKSLFDEVYKNKKYKRTFNPDIVNELSNYKMGIFGSITTTSDIDIGIQYSGSNSKLFGLSYIVSVFEDSFLIFTGIDSLHFDIETYADMMTLPNLDEKTKKQHNDIFYLDTTHFEKEHFDLMKPYIEASILRNYITAEIYNGKTDISKMIQSFSYKDFYEKLTQAKVSLPEDIKEEYINNSSIEPETIHFISDYMNSEYDLAREKYYIFVNDAEMSLINVKEQNNSPSHTINLSPDEIREIMQKIAKALIYRAESYTCAPTVIHVVRVLQANSKNPNKYKTIEPGYCKTNRLKDAYCNIGKYGYIISIYEQLGYIYRFYLTYCIGGKNQTKCDKKIEKYDARVKNAIENNNNIKLTGGKLNFFKFMKNVFTKRNKQKKKKTIKKKRNKRIKKNKKE